MFALKVVCLCLSVAVFFGKNSIARFEKEYEICESELNMLNGNVTNNALKTEIDYCLLACVFKKIKWIVDGKFDEEATGNYIENYYQNVSASYIIEEKKSMVTCAKKAQSETNTECNLVKAMLACLESRRHMSRKNECEYRTINII